MRAQILRDFEGVAARFPDVVYQVVAAHGRPADVLVAASESVRMVVVGRHDPVIPMGSHLGPVTRTVLNHAACPVLVVDPRPGAED